MTQISAHTCQQLHNSIFRFIRKQRFVGLQHGIPADQIGDGLSPTEQSILFILNAEPEKNVKELALAIGLERSWMSRVVSSLEERKLVLSEVSLSDKRNKNLRLTAKGIDILNRNEAKVSLMMEENVATLSASEQKEFSKSLAKFADGLQAKSYSNTSSQHEIAYQLGRLSAGFGMYAERMFETDLTVTYVHTLLALEEHLGSPIQIGELTHTLPFDISTVSRTIDAFAKLKWVKKTQSKIDKRSFEVQLSNAGEEILKDYFSKVTAVFRKALARFTSTELDRLMQLYEKVATQIPYPARKTRGSGTSLSRELSDREFQEALKKLPSLHKNSKNVGYFVEEEISAVLSIQRDDSDNSITSIALRTHGLPTEKLIEFIRSCIMRAS